MVVGLCTVQFLGLCTIRLPKCITFLMLCLHVPDLFLSLEFPTSSSLFCFYPIRCYQVSCKLIYCRPLNFLTTISLDMMLTIYTQPDTGYRWTHSIPRLFSVFTYVCGLPCMCNNICDRICEKVPFPHI